jgi:SAM-dependent methyltransferase
VTAFPSPSAIGAFDRVAASYDRSFTDTRLGRELRGLVWDRLLERFPPGGRLLELNCGTGEDATFLASRGFHVTATDGSDAMLDAVRRKMAAESESESCASVRVRLRKLDLADPRGPFAAGSFDGAFSNFGGLNCVADLAPLAAALSHWLRPGAPLLLVVMGPLCLWETTISLARGRFRNAFRRLARTTTLGRVGEVSFPIVYPWPSEVARSFAPSFRCERVEGLGVALPPTALGLALEARPRLLRALAACERVARRPWPLRLLGDHYLAELRREQ